MTIYKHSLVLKLFIINDLSYYIFISGELALGALSSGAGSVTILNNLIQGNLAGAGDGGGIRVVGMNGADVAESGNTPANWYALDIINNIIVNNVSAVAGGGISLADATRVRIINNTVANNDSSATALAAFAVNCRQLHAADRRHCHPPAQHGLADLVGSDLCQSAVAEQHHLPEPVVLLTTVSPCRRGSSRGRPGRIGTWAWWKCRRSR